MRCSWASPPALPRHDLYLITDHHDVPWESDGLREGELEVRASMTAWFSETLTAYGQSWVLLTGSLEERLDLALRCVELVLADRLHFAAARDQATT